jgi:hypothetical protein
LLCVIFKAINAAPVDTPGGSPTKKSCTPYYPVFTPKLNAAMPFKKFNL